MIKRLSLSIGLLGIVKNSYGHSALLVRLSERKSCISLPGPYRPGQADLLTIHINHGVRSEKTKAIVYAKRVTSHKITKAIM